MDGVGMMEALDMIWGLHPKCGSFQTSSQAEQRCRGSRDQSKCGMQYRLHKDCPQKDWWENAVDICSSVGSWDSGWSWKENVQVMFLSSGLVYWGGKGVDSYWGKGLFCGGSIITTNQVVFEKNNTIYNSNSHNNNSNKIASRQVQVNAAVNSYFVKQGMWLRRLSLAM